VQVTTVRLMPTMTKWLVTKPTYSVSAKNQDTINQPRYVLFKRTETETQTKKNLGTRNKNDWYWYIN
jgi:hypothetical protein